VPQKKQNFGVSIVLLVLLHGGATSFLFVCMCLTNFFGRDRPHISAQINVFHLTLNAQKIQTGSKVGFPG